MGKTKYMMSMGLAFFEATDMNNLRKKSLQGWHLKRFRFLGYELERGECQDVMYSIDYRLLEPGDLEEYFEMFTFGGWTHVCSEYNMHIFKAPKGTKPIYSDVESSKDKMVRLAIPVQKVVALSVTATIGFGLVMTFTTGIIHTISRWGTSIGFIITVPAIMTLLATYFHRWKYKRK